MKTHCILRPDQGKDGGTVCICSEYCREDWDWRQTKETTQKMMQDIPPIPKRNKMLCKMSPMKSVGLVSEQQVFDIVCRHSWLIKISKAKLCGSSVSVFFGKEVFLWRMGFSINFIIMCIVCIYYFLVIIPSLFSGDI